MQEPYRDHYHEAGFNALFFMRAAHSWARSLRIVNADYGIGLEHAHFCTVEDVELTTDFKRDTLSRGVFDVSYEVCIKPACADYMTNHEARCQP